MAWSIFIVAAVLEVGGDAVVRQGPRGHRPLLILLGGVMLAAYGIVVNMVSWDFSKLLGVYVAFFTLVSLLAGRLLWQEAIPTSTWIGVGGIVSGGMIIQFSSKPLRGSLYQPAPYVTIPPR